MAETVRDLHNSLIRCRQIRTSITLWILGILIVVIGSVIGWVRIEQTQAERALTAIDRTHTGTEAAIQTRITVVEDNLVHIRTEQTEMKKDIKDFRKEVKDDTRKILERLPR